MSDKRSMVLPPVGRSKESHENTLRLSREAKRKRTGTCRVCGGETRYAGKKGNAVSVQCKHCAAGAMRELNIARRGTGPTISRVLAYLSEPRSVSQVSAKMKITREHASVQLRRLIRYGKVRRVSRGVYERIG